MKKIISIILILSIILVSCSKEENIEKKFFKTYKVSSWLISSKDSILETVEWKNTTLLSFKNPWRITNIFVKEWDKVKSWQILATLWNEEANINLIWSYNILEEIQNMWINVYWMWNDTKNIKNSLNNLYDEKIKLIELEYNKAKIATQISEKDLNLAKSNYDDTSLIFSWTLLSSEQTIKQAENAYNLANNNLENTKKLLELEKNNIEKNAVNSLTNAYIIARNAKNYLDNILWITNENKDRNDYFELFLWAKNFNSKTKAEDSFRIFNNKYEQTYKLYQENIVDKTNIPKDTLIIVLNNALETLNSLRNNLHDTMDLLDNSVTSSNFDENTLNWMKNQITILIANLEQAILNPSAIWMTWVKWSIEGIESFDKNYDLKIKQLEDSLNIAYQNLELTKTWKDITKNDNSKNISNLQTNISIKEDNLNLSKIWEIEIQKSIELTKKEKESKLSELDAKISEIQSKLSEIWSKKAELKMNSQLAQNNIESWIIKAPFDWIIIKKMIDIWSVVWAWIPIITITSLDWKYIKTYINNENYNKNIWDNIQLINENNNYTSNWIISLLNETKDIINKKNYTEIEIKDIKINIWDRYFINISWKNKPKQIIIPQNSIIDKYTEPWVFVYNNWIANFKIIKIIESDNNFVAIDWLKIWDIIITDWKDNILDWERLN